MSLIICTVSIFKSMSEKKLDMNLFLLVCIGCIIMYGT